MPPTGNSHTAGALDSSKVRLSLVVPFFNEEAVLEQNLSEIRAYLENRSGCCELILADDGSRDRSAEIARAFAARCSFAQIITNDTNMGKGGILQKALSLATGEVLAYIDADLEISLSSLTTALNMLEQRLEVDICIGSKQLLPQGKRRPFHRNAGTVVYNTLVRQLLHSGVTDHQCGLKVFRRASGQPILSRMQEVGWAWDTEFLLRAQLAGCVIAEVPVTLQHRRRSRVPFWKVVGQLMTKLMVFRNRGLILRG